jgi:hypothetical protein
VESSTLMNQGSERTESHNHYTTAPLVITRVTWMTLPRRLITTSAIKNTSKNRRCNQTNLITRWGLTNRCTATLFDDRLNLSKTQTLMWRLLLNKKELGVCKSLERNPNGFQHGTRANGPTDGDTAPDRFWMPTCFNDSHRLRSNFEVALVPLEAL